METKFPENLSHEQRRKGQKLYRRFLTVNGIAVPILMENVLILFAIRNGVTDPQIAILASFVHITMPFMLVGKRMTAHRGISAAWGRAWLYRYFAISPILLAPIAARIHPLFGPVLILLCIFGFSIFRAMGMMNTSPMVGEITDERDRGTYISKTVLRFNLAYIVAMGSSILLLKFWDKLATYQIIIAAGILSGFYGSYLLLRIPESATPSRSAKKPIRESFAILWKQKSLKRLMFAWAGGLTAFSIVIPFSIVTLKNGYGLDDHIALLYSLMLTAGGILCSFTNGSLADHTGPRPLLILYTSGFFLISLFWAFAPAAFHPVLVCVVLFLSGFCKTGIIVGLGHYFLSLVEEKDRVGLSMIVRVFSGIFSGLSTSVGSALLLSLLDSVSISGLALYRNYFRIIFLALIPLFILVYRTKRLKEWKIKSILGLILSFRDIRALSVLNKLSSSTTPKEEAVHLNRLKEIGSHLSEESLLNYISSPRLSIRLKAMEALRRIDFSKKAEQVVLKQLKEGEYTTAWLAADIAGEKEITSAVPLLNTHLDSSDHFLTAKCMLALARMEHEKSYSKIRERFRNSENPRILIYGAAALAKFRNHEENTAADIISKLITAPDQPPPVKQQLLTIFSSLFGSEDEFYGFLKEYNDSPVTAVKSIAADFPEMEKLPSAYKAAAESKLIKESLRILEGWVENGNLPEILKNPVQLALLAHNHDLFLSVALILAAHPR